MSKRLTSDSGPVTADWRSAADYRALLLSDRRGFAWEWLRRNADYRAAWRDGARAASDFGLFAFEDPGLAFPAARPIWTPAVDPHVLASSPLAERPRDEGLLDIRDLARFVSVEVDAGSEHWLLTDGRWVVRLDLYDGTLLGGPVLLDHRLRGLAGLGPKLHTLRQLAALADLGEMPASLRPREVRAPRWILELRTADALAAGATQQHMARTFFGTAIAGGRWRVESASYRLRVQRLVRAARRNLADPLCGPWFD